MEIGSLQYSGMAEALENIGSADEAKKGFRCFLEASMVGEGYER